MYKNLLRRLAATGAALSVGGMALLCGCNHDRDCDSCDTHPAPVVGPRVSDTYIQDEGAQPTSFGGTVEATPQFENDIYFRDHRNDPNFDRDAYFRDRAAYIRAHEGDAWWNDHRADLEASWRPGNRVSFENDVYFRDHRNDPNFDRDAYFRDRAAYIRAHEGDAYWNDHRAEFEKSWNVGVRGNAGNGDVYFREHRNDPNFDRDAYFRDRGAYIRAHEGDAYWNDHRADLEKSWGTGVRGNMNTETNRDFNRDTEARKFNRDHQMDTSTDRQMNNAADRNLNRDMNAQPKSDLNANAPKSDTNLNTNNTEVKNRSDANLPKTDVNAPKADVNAPKADVSAPKAEANTPPVRSSTEAGATVPSSSEKSAESRNMKDQNEALNTSNNTSSSGTSTTNSSTSAGTTSSNNPGSEVKGSAGTQGTTAPGSSTKGTSEGNSGGSSSNSSGASSGGM